MSYGQYSDRSRGRSNPLDRTAVKAKKQVFDTSEIAHLWAHQTQDAARNAQGNFYFIGKTIYSYGSHFPIAEIVKAKRGGDVVLLTTARYSVTTSGHQNMVWSAIPATMQKFSVEDIHAKPSENLKDYNARILQAQKKAAKARTSVEWNLAEVAKLHDEATRYAIAFRLSPNSVVPLGNVEDIKAAVKAAEQRERESKKRRLAKLTKEGEPLLELWRAGRESEIPYDKRATAQELAQLIGPLLRIQGENIHTSMGAVFPLSHAKRGLALVRAVRERGEEWKANGHTCHLGHYAIDRIEANGTVHAGCHVVKYAEIERLAPQIEAYRDAA